MIFNNLNWRYYCLLVYITLLNSIAATVFADISAEHDISQNSGELNSGIVFVTELDQDEEMANKQPGFISEYLLTIPPFILKEGVKKAAGRFLRSTIITGDLNPAFPAMELATGLRRNVAESLRNIYSLAKKADAQKDYEQAGRIIRNALLGHILIWPLQIGVGYASAPVFQTLGLPPEICNLVDLYSRQNSYVAPAHELSGKTAVVLLLVEHPEYQWAPTALHTILLYLFYSSGLKQGADVTQRLTQLIFSEAAASVMTAGIVLNFILFDNKHYGKYGIFNTTSSDLLNFDTLKEIGQYSWPVFASQFAGIVTGVFDIMLIGMIGREALNTKKDFDQMALILNTIIAASTQTIGTMVANSLATDSDASETKGTMYTGLVLNSMLSAVYFVIFVTPKLLTSPQGYTMAKISALSGFVINIERAVKDELAAFKQKDQGWLRSIGDIAKIAVPAGGAIFFRFRVVEPNVQNYLRIRITTLMFTVCTILSLFQVNI